MKTRFCSIILIFAVVVSCAKTSESSMSMNEPNQLSDVVVTISEDTYPQERKVNSVNGDFGKYVGFFSQPDATIGISSSRYYPLGDETVFAYYDPVEANVATKSFGNDHAYDIKINGMNVFAQNTRSGNGAIAGLFGNKVTFDLSAFGSLTKSGDNSVELYAPEMVRIQFPAIDSEDDRYPLCYYEDFVVRWNQDVSNENGVVIIVKWNGMMVFGEDYSSSYVYHVTCVPDTGTAELDESMFDGIPDTAFCSMCLLRGDIDNIMVDEDKFRLLVESHDVLDFVLVRNIK